MKCKIIDNEVYKRYVLHEFTLMDFDDVEIHAADPICKWQQTPEGKFCIKKAKDLEYHSILDHATLYRRVFVTGYLTSKHATFWELKRV